MWKPIIYVFPFWDSIFGGFFILCFSKTVIDLFFPLGYNVSRNYHLKGGGLYEAYHC